MTFLLLDLFCGGGGSAMGYHQALEAAGIPHEIVGIDHKPMPRYPFTFILADAPEYCAEHGAEFDFIHASPPCQKYSRMQNVWKSQDKHPDLVAETRGLLEVTGRPFVIENVIGAPIRLDVILCGTMFGLPIIRHRGFECGWSISPMTETCNHTNVFDPWHGAGRTADKFRAALGIDWLLGGGRHKQGSVDEAIPPAYTKWIMERYLAQEHARI